MKTALGWAAYMAAMLALYPLLGSGKAIDGTFGPWGFWLVVIAALAAGALLRWRTRKVAPLVVISPRR